MQRDSESALGRPAVPELIAPVKILLVVQKNGRSEVTSCGMDGRRDVLAQLTLTCSEKSDAQEYLTVVSVK